jgi:glucosyl-3-phosphoglycerate synthase
MINVVIPAYNEESNIVSLVRSLKTIDIINEIIVIDNNSTDKTQMVLKQANVTILPENIQGKGAALKRGINYSNNNIIFCCDGDVVGINKEILLRICDPVILGKVPFSRASLNRCVESAPVTTILVKPILNALFGDNTCQEPLGGIFCFDKSQFDINKMPDNWGVDISLTLDVINRFGSINEVPCYELTHRQKSLSDYSIMANEICQTLLSLKIISRLDGQIIKIP